MFFGEGDVGVKWKCFKVHWPTVDRFLSTYCQYDGGEGHWYQMIAPLFECWTGYQQNLKRKGKYGKKIPAHFVIRKRKQNIRRNWVASCGGAHSFKLLASWLAGWLTNLLSWLQLLLSQLANNKRFSIVVSSLLCKHKLVLPKLHNDVAGWGNTKGVSVFFSLPLTLGKQNPIWPIANVPLPWQQHKVILRRVKNL